MSAAQMFDFNAVLQWALSPDACAWLASALVLATFCMKRMVPLRLIGISSNVGFFTYALWLHLTPVIVLHGLLFPINVFRLWQCLRRSKTERSPPLAMGKPPAVNAMGVPVCTSATWRVSPGTACTPMCGEAATGSAERWQTWSASRCYVVQVPQASPRTMQNRPQARVATPLPQCALPPQMGIAEAGLTFRYSLAEIRHAFPQQASSRPREQGECHA